MFKSVLEVPPIRYTGEDFSLPSESVEQFYEDGFLVVEDVFSPEELITLKEVADAEMSKTHTPGKLDWPLHRLQAARSEIFRRLCTDPRIVKLLKPFLGENIQLQHSKFAIKQPGENRGVVRWHQDFAFLPHTNDSLVAIAISLTDVTPENGGMMMVKGSHKEGLLNHRHPDGTFAERCMDEDIVSDPSRYRWVCPKAGGISIHHCLTVHSSHDNLTPDPRYMVVFEYKASDAYQLADGIWDDTGLQICGAPLERVRFGGKFLKRDEDGSFVLPLPRSERYGPDFPFGHAYNQFGSIAKQTCIFFHATPASVAGMAASSSGYSAAISMSTSPLAKY